MREIYYLIVVVFLLFSKTIVAQGPPEPCDDGSTPTRVYPDKDGDFFGTLQGAKFVCGPVPNGYVVNFRDCDDNNPAINPSATEICDGIDNNCNDQVDEVVVTRIYVDWNAAGNGNGLSWTNAYTKLQDALARASICASVVEIWVAEGTYYPDEQGAGNTNDRMQSFNLKNNLVIYGGFAGNETLLSQRNWNDHLTILSGEIQQNNIISDNSSNVVKSDGHNNTAILDGLKIVEGNGAGPGGGLYITSSSPVIINCTFSNNRGNNGGGIANLNSSSPKITNCVFTGNYTYQNDGGAIYNLNSSPVITNCRFLENASNSQGGAIYNTFCNGVTILNSIFWKNTASEGGGVYSGNSTVTITNCSFSKNTAVGGGVYNSSSVVSITNCILWGNTNNQFQNADVSAGDVVFNHCIVSVSGLLGTGNINKDPIFLDPDNGDLHIPSCSPAIDKGNNPSITATTDLDGNNRKHNATGIAATTVDIGAYEFTGSATPELISYKDADNDGYSDGTVSYCQKPVGYKLANELTATVGDCDDNNIEINPAAIDLCDGLDNNCDGIVDPPDRLYVKFDANGSNSGTSWANAFTKLQDALLAARNCSNVVEIWVAKGTYYPDEGLGQTNNDRFASFIMRNNLAIYGGFFGNETGLSQRIPQANETILSGDIDQNDGADLSNINNNSYHLVLNDNNGLNNTAILDRFTVRAGLANFNDNTSIAGAGILNRNASPLINDCKFIDHTATLGAAIANLDASSVVITNCIFENNIAARGGAISNILATLTIKGCSFSNNKSLGVTQSVIGGGAIDNQSAHVVILDSRFSGNSGRFGGAISNTSSSTSTITNSIFLNNTVEGFGGAILNYNTSRSRIVNCSFYKNTAGQLGNCIVNGATSSSNAVNSIFWGSPVQFYNEANSKDTVTYSIVDVALGVYPGLGNSKLDPLFVDATNGDLHLLKCSPALNKGNDAANNEPTDLDGNPRKTGTIDMGAYEASDLSMSIIYVNKNATGLNNGTSWQNAYTNLQDALSVPCLAFAQIWVAKGTYYPDEGGGKTDNDRDAYFVMRNNVEIYGGFAGDETSLEQRNWKINKTILSGDIDQNDDTDPSRANNSKNVIRNQYSQDHQLTNSARIDGFTITGGNGGLEYGVGGSVGGGISNEFSSPTIVNCIFTHNTGILGGALYNEDSSPQVINCLFSFNSSGDTGGAVLNQDSYASYINCTFVKNTNKTIGGHSIGNTGISSTVLKNCIVWANGSSLPLSGIYTSATASISITYSFVEGGFAGEGNIPVFVPGVGATNPLFVDLANGDFHLQQQSPAVNAGSNAANNATLDLDANPRKAGTIDMGAYETVFVCQPVSEWVIDLDNDNFYITGSQVVSCTSPGGNYVLKGDKQPGDCNEFDDTIYPGAPEICDNKDNDCDGQIDETKRLAYIDSDGDGFTLPDRVEVCAENTLPLGYVATSNGVDCNDNDASVPRIYYPDADNDGFTLGGGVLFCTATAPEGYKNAQSTSPDCNDADGAVQTPILYWPDEDGDGFGYDVRTDPRVTSACWHFAIHPIFGGMFAFVGHGNPTCDPTTEPTKVPRFFCLSTAPDGWSSNNTDCNDLDITIYPGAPELFDGKDNDCDGEIESCAPVSFTTSTLQALQTSGCGTGDIASVTFAYSTTLVALTAQQHTTLNLPIAEGSCDLQSVRYIDVIDQVQTAGQLKVTRTFTATDESGSTATITQQITVVDGTAPAFTGVYNTVPLGCNPNAAAIEYALGSATATDNCDNETISHIDGSIVSDGCNRSKTRTFKAIDGLGNTSTVSRTVTWTADVTPPGFTGYYTDVNLGCNPANPSGSLGTATATDACGVITNISSSDGSVVSSGCSRSRTRTFTATDSCLNTSTISRTVRWIEDVTPPVFTGYYTDVNLGCNPANPSGSLGTATATDACGTITNISSSDGSVVSSGCNRSKTRTFTATDGCLNTSTISRTVRWTEDVTPPVFTGYYTDVNLGCNPADPSGSLGMATATDACGTITNISSSDGNVISSGCNRSKTRTFTATDGCLNTSTISRTVRWIEDVTAPTLYCAKSGTVTKSTNSDLCTYSVAGTEFDPTASDICSTPTLTWKVSGATASDGSGSMNGTVLNFGYNTIKWTATDGCNNTSTCSFIVHVNKVTTTTSLVVSTTPATNPVTQQYSDKITCVATVTLANCPGAGPIGGTVTFKIITTEGTVVLGSAPVGSDGKATLEDTLLENQFYPGATNLSPSNGPLKPGNKTVTAAYSNTDPDYAITNPTAPLVVTCEDAEITYNGLNYFGANPTTNQGVITVSAFVLDKNDAPSQARGDIRNATVTFREGTSGGTVIGTAGIPVGLVNPTIYQEGIVTTNSKVYTLTAQEISCGGKIIDVWAGTNNYYCGEFDEVVPVCLSLPGGDYVTGGGWIKMQNSAGSYAGTIEKKMHAALAFKWNKSSKNLQGNATIIYKRVVNGVQKVYQIKSNSITSMIVNNVNDAGVAVTTGATYRMAQIVTKANFRDLTDPDFPIALFGNLTLTITAWESINTTDGSKDRISVQLVGSGSQGLIFSSNWLNGTTLWQQLGGGKMRVRNPSAEIPCTNCSGSGITAKPGEMEKATEVLPGEDLKVVAMPNPSSSYFAIVAKSNDKKEKILVQVVDAAGRIMETKTMYADEIIRLGDRYRPGFYVARFIQGRQVTQVKLIKSSD